MYDYALGCLHTKGINGHGTEGAALLKFNALPLHIFRRTRTYFRWVPLAGGPKVLQKLHLLPPLADRRNRPLAGHLVPVTRKDTHTCLIDVLDLDVETVLVAAIQCLKRNEPDIGLRIEGV